jgi:cyclopropane-fatty-acyl-phospholipid synthase
MPLRPEPDPSLHARLRALVPADTCGAVRWEDGHTSALGDGPPRFTLVVRSSRALAELALRPSMLALGEAFIDGAFDVEGDLLAAIAAAYGIAERFSGDVAGSERGATSVPPDARSRIEATAAHYDRPREFYALFLDRHMVYTCAYYPSAAATLEEAQEAKLDLVCRKLGLGAGERFLDVGCGWGALVIRAAGRYGAEAHGVTLSSAQAEWATTRIAHDGLGTRARVEHRDVHELAAPMRYDKVAALGVIEHVGVAHYPTYFARIRDLVRPGGLFLSHGITHRTTSPQTSGMAFLDRYVFPGGDLATLDYTVEAMQNARFTIVHVEALGLHYVRTLREWLARLLSRRDDAVARVGERTYRIYVGYLAAAAVAFEAGWIDVHQVLARRA